MRVTLDPVIHQATRLRIMAALQRNRELGFTRLRDGLGLTDGNLGSHAAALERAGYVQSRRVLAGLGFEVRYRITSRGSTAFEAYARELLALLDSAAPGQGSSSTDPVEPASLPSDPAESASPAAGSVKSASSAAGSPGSASSAGDPPAAASVGSVRPD